MQNALYFPYTHIRTDRLLKCALLLWDQLEYITPYDSYPINYSDLVRDKVHARTLEEAHGLVCREHVPTEDESKDANDRILDLATTPNLPTWFIKRAKETPGFLIHYGKLFEDTWDKLRKLGIATISYGPNHVSVPTAFGRASTSILAQSCAGNDTELVTDSVQATNGLRTTAEIEERTRQRLPLDSKDTSFSAIEALNLIRVDGYTLQTLIEFRKKEQHETGSYQRQFRKNYWARLDIAVQEYRKAKNAAERRRVRDRFYESMQDDFKFLKDELGLSRAEALFETDTANLVSFGTALTTAITTGGTAALAMSAITAVRATFGKLTRYWREKSQTELKRPSAYMYLFRNVVNRRKPLKSI